MTAVLAGWSPVEPSSGTFHAVHSRDAVATSRDGGTYVAVNRDDSPAVTSCGTPFYEVLLDGEWMLACGHDLGVTS